MSDVLSNDEIERVLGQRSSDWRLEGGTLVKDVRRQRFNGALAYVNDVGALAEAADHHPDIDIRWDTVTLRLSTHSAGGITRLDLDLAARIDGLDVPG